MNQFPTTWRWAIKAEATDADAEPPKSKYAGNTPEARSARARHAALVRYGKENPMQARLAKIREKRKAKAGKGGSKDKAKAAPAPAAPPATGAEREAFLASLGLDANNAEALSEYLGGLADGEEMALNRKAAEALQALGLIKIRPGQEGSSNLSIDLTGPGKRLQAAVSKGDIAKGMSIVEAGNKRAAAATPDKAATLKDKLAKGKDDAQAFGDKKPEEKPKGGGGGGGGSKKPEEKKEDAAAADDPKAKARALVRDSTARDVGLKPGEGEALRAAADGEGGEPPAALVKLGLVGADGLTTDSGRRALVALERGDKAGYQAALQDVRARADRDAERDKVKGALEKARAEREKAKADAETARTKEKDAAEAQELDDLADDFRAKRKGLSLKEQRRLVRAGRATFGKDGAFALNATKAWRWAEPYAIKHGSHNQATHGRKGRAGRAGASAYAAARAGGASHQEARAAGTAATAAERAAERAERAQARTERLQTQAARARAAANGGQVTPAQAARLNAKADRLEARARGETVGPATKPGAPQPSASQPVAMPPIPPSPSGGRIDPQTFRAREDALRAREKARATALANRPALPPVSAVSEKQRTFAESTRTRILQDIEKQRASFLAEGVRRGVQDLDTQMARFDQAIANLSTQTDARFWLDTARNQSATQLLRMADGMKVWRWQVGV